jgi:hypothetical protein
MRAHMQATLAKAPAQTLMHKAETLLKWEGTMSARQVSSIT